MLEPLLLIERGLHPQAGRVGQEVLGKAKHTLDIELFQPHLMQLKLSEGQLLPELVALPVIGRLVDSLAVDERLVQFFELLTQRGDPALCGRAEPHGTHLAVLPAIQHDLSEQPHVGDARLQSFYQCSERRLQPVLRHSHRST